MMMLMMRVMRRVMMMLMMRVMVRPIDQDTCGVLLSTKTMIKYFVDEVILIFVGDTKIATII